MVRLTCGSALLFLVCVVSARPQCAKGFCMVTEGGTSTPAVHSVPFYKKFSGKVKSIKTLLARDLARYKVDTVAARAVGEAPGTNNDFSYVAATKVGTQTFELLVDTGSSLTWVGAETRYTPGSTAVNTGKRFSVIYGDESTASGTEYTDTVVIGGLTIRNQSFGDATRSSGFNGVDGIIGFGPVDLTQGTVSGVTTVPTVMNNLFSQGTISTQVLGISFAPESGSDNDDTNGELTLGGTDPTKYSGSITWAPTTTASPYNRAVVDTGTTLIYIPTAAYNSFLTASGGHTDHAAGLASWTALPTHNFAFTIGGVSFSLTPSQFTVPTAQYADWGLPSGKFYGLIANGGTVAAGVNFILGQKFLENYYSVFDTTDSRVGFATGA
ncbi:Acid protease [Mycena sanguinolenta]|uniref:Acid protease n=1 Tax=Mycena sanguinolenta TaxID=230812 RepID=A0A8H6YGQ2_9AGAR|nr:Acid protease [Mycena sanguinolenta]